MISSISVLTGTLRAEYRKGDYVFLIAIASYYPSIGFQSLPLILSGQASGWLERLDHTKASGRSAADDVTFSVIFDRTVRQAAEKIDGLAAQLDARSLSIGSVFARLGQFAVGAINLANVLEEDDRNEGALRHYKDALRIDPLFADAQLNLALLYEKLGLPRTARARWRRYLQLEPRGAWADIARKHLGEPVS